MQPSVTVSAYILSSKGANQLQVLYLKILGNIHGNFSTGVLKCISSNFFLEICRSSRTTSSKLGLEDYVLAYHAVDKDHAKILQPVFSSFSCVFDVLYKSI